MSLKLLAILGGAVVLCTAPILSNISRSVQSNANPIRIERDDTAIETETLQEELESGDRTAPSVRQSLRDIQRRVRNHTEQVRAPRMAASYSVQESSLDLELADLRDPYTLTVRPSAGAMQLKGTIKLNGKTLKTLGKGTVQFNLSPYLRRGRHKLEITGSYRPASASVEISLEGPSAETTQEMGGSGTINQTIRINVQ